MKINTTHPQILSASKLLSWLAVNAGISMTTAEQLWCTACQDAIHLAAPDTSDFYGRAINRLVELIETESTRRDIVSFGFRPWARYQAKLLSAGSAYIDSCRQMHQHRLNSLSTKRMSRPSLTLFLLHHVVPAAESPRSQK